MKFRPLLTILALAGGSAIADVDYSRCNYAAGLMGSSLDNDGQLKLSLGQKIGSKTTEGKIEKYVIETDPQIYGGIGVPGQAPFKTEISIERDDQGRVVKVTSGGEKLDKKAIENRKKAALQTQVSTALLSQGMSSSYQGSAFGTMPGTEPLYRVKDKEGKFSYRKLTELSKDERSQVGLNEELHKEMTQKWRKDKKSVEKIEKGLKSFQDKSTPVFWLGQETEFDIKDGVCTPKTVSSRLFNTADGSISKTPIFTKEACEEVSKLYLKHKDKISKCDDSVKEINNDLWQSNDKIKELYNGGMFGMGVGYGYGTGFGGIGIGHGFSSSQLSTLKNTCDVMVGEIKFGTGMGLGKEVKPTSVTQQ